MHFCPIVDEPEPVNISAKDWHLLWGFRSGLLYSRIALHSVLYLMVYLSLNSNEFFGERWAMPL